MDRQDQSKKPSARWSDSLYVDIDYVDTDYADIDTPPGKEPWLAVLLSSLLPGAGQIYAGASLRGIIWLVLMISLMGAGLWTFLFARPSLLIQGGIVYIILHISNLIDAFRCTTRANSSEFEHIRKREKDPWLAVFLTTFIPGLGHAYQQDWLAAILFFIGINATRALAKSVFQLHLIAIGALLFCIYHVYISSPAKREKTGEAITSLLIVILASIAVSIVLALSLRAFAVEARYMPSESMTPTLQVDDRFAVNKLAYLTNDPQRGDVVIFSPPESALVASGIVPSKDIVFVKRIVGLPNETIEIAQGQVFIDGAPIEEDYIQAPPTYTFGPTTVPDNAYVVLGDNRNSSLDSHIWGFLPRENIRGRANQIFWPPSRKGNIE